MHYPAFLEDPISFPRFYKVCMNYPRTSLTNIENTISRELAPVIHTCDFRPGDTVAVAVGSRGISRLPLIVKTVCEKIKQTGATPVIVPAMGSHGGATGPGQKDVLAALGVTESSCGEEVRSSMDADEIGRIWEDVPVYYARDILAMDHAVCINRIKPHTKFKGAVESGIYKMLCIGMGKHLGALSLHRAALRHGFYPTIKQAGDTILSKSNIRFALGVVENQFDDIADIRVMSAKDIFSMEQELLIKAKSLFPTLPFKNLDVLIVREIGKNISGSGMDPNVTGRACDFMEDDFSGILNVTRVALLDLSGPSSGNAIGLGNADFITEKLYAKMDYEKTLINALTSMSLRKAFIPVRLRHDRMAIQAALTTCGLDDPSLARAVIVDNTREISRFWVSSALKNEVESLGFADIKGDASLEFTEAGDLVLG